MGRFKDYYDLYFLISSKNYSVPLLQEAIVKTFKKRNTDLSKINLVLNEINESNFIKELWENYMRRYSYAENVKFETIMKSMQEILAIIN